jgi:hypothetical protein
VCRLRLGVRRRGGGGVLICKERGKEGWREGGREGGKEEETRNSFMKEGKKGRRKKEGSSSFCHMYR